MKTYFPVIASFISPQALIDEVLPDFGVKDVVDCRLYQTGFNDTYSVKTKPGKTYYLRVYRKNWRTLPDIKYELDVLNHLKLKGFPAAKPISRKEGSYLSEINAPEGTRYAVVFEEAPGEENSYDDAPEKTSEVYGQAVARLHIALDDFTSEHKRFHKDLAHLIDKPLRNIEPFLSHRKEEWEFLQNFTGKVRERLMTMPIEDLKMGVCHGDTQGFHVKVDKDGTMTFYDFDCGGYGYQAFDLAVFRWSAQLDDAEDVWWAHFLEGYQEIRPINEIDLQAIPYLVCCRYIWHMGVHSENSPDWGSGFLNNKYFDGRLKTLRKLENEYF